MICWVVAVYESGMKSEEIRGKVRRFILEEFLPGTDAGELTDDIQLMTGGVLNSLSTTRLVAFLEEEFGIEVEAHEMGADYLDSVDQMVLLVEEKRAAKG